MDGPNPYEPPRSGQTKSPKMGPMVWLISWSLFVMIFCAAFMGGDPFNSIILMGFGAMSFFLGSLFARAGQKGIVQSHDDPSGSN